MELVEEYPSLEDEAEIVLVFIPSIADDRKQPPKIEWKHILPRISPAPRRTSVFMFRHRIGSKDPFQNLLDCGANLFPEMDSLQLTALTRENKSPRVFLICEMLGGLIAKESFANTIDKLASWTPFLNSIRGLFFIGVPHVGADHDLDGLAAAMGRKVEKLRKKVLSDDVIYRLRMSAMKFKRMAMNLDSNLFVVSVYDDSPKKWTVRKVFSSSPTSMLEVYVRIGLKKEECVSLDLGFESLWDPKSLTPFQSILSERLTAVASSTISEQSRNQSQLAARDPSILQHKGTMGLRENQAGSSHPGPSGSVKIPSSLSTGSQSLYSSYAVLTPPISSSPVSTTVSRNSSSPKVALIESFHFPESCIDHQRYFRGRKRELDQITALLLPGDATQEDSTSLRFFAISGPGGVGKTELVHKFIAEHHEKYDVVLFIRADETNRLSQQFEKLALKFGLVRGADKPSLEECREVLKAWFKSPHGSRVDGKSGQPIHTDSTPPRLKWLLVFDNVERWATLDPFWPYGGRGTVLITSRNPNICPQLAGIMNTLELHNLPVEEAGHVLKHYAGFDEDDTIEVQKAAREVAGRLEGLPLAVVQVGSNIKECHSSIAGFSEVHPRQSHLYGLFLDKGFSHGQGYDHNLASVWALESLSGESEASQEAFAMLCVIAFMDSECISAELLRPDPERRRLPNYPHTEPDLYQRRKMLTNASLVERGPSESDIKVHRMVQQVVRAKVSKDPLLAENVFHDALTRVSMHWPYLTRIYVIGTQGKVDRWPRCAELLPHVLSVSQGYSELRDIGSLSQPSLDLAELLYEASNYHIERNDPSQATQLLDLASSICDSTKGNTDLTEYHLRIWRGRIGVAFLTRDQTEYHKHAEKCYKVEMGLYEKHARFSVGLATANLHMGIAYNMNSLYQEAMPFLDESARIRKGLPGFKNDWLFSPMYQLAHSHLHLGDYAKAAELLETAIENRREVLGENDRFSARTGALYYTLGDVKSRQGHFDQSLSLHLRAEIHFRLTTGPTNLGTLHCKFKIATHYASLCDYERARTILDEILYFYDLMPHARRYVCRAAWLYSECLRSVGEDFSPLLDKAVQVFNDFSPNDQRTAYSLTETDVMSLISYDYL